MVVIIATYTEAINPPSASPSISQSQFWEGMLYCATHTHEFVKSVESCKVLSRTDEEIVISQIMHHHPTPGHYAGEHSNTFFLSPPYKFDMIDTGETDFHCLAIVAHGPGGDTDLYYTVVYEWNEKNMRRGSAEHKEKMTSHVRPEELVRNTIEKTRRMVKNGEL